MCLNLSYLNVEKLYSNLHNVEILTANGISNCRNILININKLQQSLEVKLRDQDDFSFNFTAKIDWLVFSKMKSEQCLEICFEEFHLQFIDLLKQTLLKEMLLRLEQGDGDCKMIFYEKSKIKSLIFLIIDFKLADQKDIIDEMASNIKLLRESNHNINYQLQTVKNQLKEKDVLLNNALATNHRLEKQFMQDLKKIENTFGQNLVKIERYTFNKVDNLNRRFDKMLKNIDAVKMETKYKENVYSQTMFQLEQFKRDNEKNYKIIDSLKIEIDALNSLKIQNERIAVDLRQSIVKKEKEIERLNEQNDLNENFQAELRKDIQEATIIIAQKTKTHDEIAKDLVQANTMLVNFNKQYDNVSKEVDNLREIIKGKDHIVEEQSQRLISLNEEFMKYKREFNEEGLCELHNELRQCREKITTLEKHNREVVKVNGLLTKKLASGDTFDARTMHWMPSK